MKIYDTQGRIVLDVEVDDSSYRHRVIKGDHNLTLKYSLAEHVELPVGVYCMFQGQRYTLERPEAFKMRHSRNFEYTVIMEAYQAKAKIWKFRNPVDGRLKFSLTARPKEHLQMFVDNMNRRDIGWTVGDCVDGVEHLINYDHDYCWDALCKQASEFETEWEIVGKRVSLRKVEYNKSNPLPLSYGCGNGFRAGLGRSNTGNNPPVEILYVQGGEQNIDRSKYGNSVLLLPKGQKIAYDGEHFEDEQGFNAATARRYVVDDLGLSIRRADKQPSSLAEDSLDCSDIYPKRVGTISSVVVVDEGKHFYDIIDDSIPEALNFEDCLIAGETMTIIFQSGMLAGREFEVKYHHSSEKGKDARRFEIVPQEIDGITMPNATFTPKAGDTYAVFKCMLPQAYIYDNATKTGAEWDMFKTAVKYLFDNEEQKFTFTGELDGIWAKKDWTNIGGRIVLGGYILFRDERFQQEGVLVRITGIKDYINKPHSPVIEISNSTVSGSFHGDIKKLEAEEVLIEDRHRDAVQFAKRRFRDAKETMAMLEQSLLDNYTNAISPIAVQTMSLLVGDESLQFRFVAGLNNPTTVSHIITYDTTTKQLKAPAGYIQHLTLGINSISSNHAAAEYKYWKITAYTSARLDDENKRYYLYIKSSKIAQTGEFLLSEKAIKMEGVSGYYHFLVGILNSEYDGERSFATLYGFTEVLPGRITTDRIVSSDGNSYFDMVADAMRLGSVFDFNSQGDGKLRLRGTLVQSEGGTESYIGCYRGVWNSEYTYYNGDEVSYTANGTTSTYRYVNATASKGHTPAETVYWQVLAAGVIGETGRDGQYTELRFAKNGSTTTPPELNKTELVPYGWKTTVPEKGTGKYVWVTSAVKTGDGLTLIRKWSTPTRMTAYDGKDGADGEHPTMVYRGIYDSRKTYYGNKYRLDCVKFGNEYYIARIDAGIFSAVAPPQTSKWNAFGASFESIATNLLLAEGANIGDWFISNGKIVSTLENGNKVILDAKKGKIQILSNKTRATFQQESLSNVEINLDSKNGQIEARDNDYNTAYMSPTGIFANRSGTRCVSASTGCDQRAAIVGLGNAHLDKSDWSIDGDEKLVAGVYGMASNSGTAPSYGGYFYNLKVKGLILGLSYVKESGVYLNDDQSLIVGISAQTCNVYLPASTRNGHTIFFKQWWTGTMNIYPRSGQKIYDDHTENDYYVLKEGQMVIATYTTVLIDSIETEVWLVNRFKY